MGFGGNVKLVKADKTYINIIFDWANDPVVRKWSFSKDSIKYEDHVKWFHNKMNDPNCIYFIGKENDKNIGQIRLDISENSGIISFSVDKEYRGRGYGLKLLQMLENYILSNMDFENFNLIGCVKKENISSVKCFLQCGYTANNKSSYIEFIKTLNG